MSSGGIESAQKEQKFTQNENYTSALLLVSLYVLLAFDVSQNQSFKKKQMCATVCN